MASWMWIIAGPNGAGKSTFAGPYLDDLHAAFPKDTGPDGITKLNADERVLELRRRFPDAARDVLNRRAAEEIDAEVVRLIGEGRSFAVETVLSTPKYRDDVEAAKAKGFQIGLIYVSLHPPELSPRRVGERVQMGGHDVNPETAVQRYHRSHEQLGWFAPRADFLMIFDNSDNRPDTVPVLLARRFPDRPLTHVQRGLNPAVDQALATLMPG